MATHTHASARISRCGASMASGVTTASVIHASCARRSTFPTDMMAVVGEDVVPSATVLASNVIHANPLAATSAVRHTTDVAPRIRMTAIAVTRASTTGKASDQTKPPLNTYRSVVSGPMGEIPRLGFPGLSASNRAPHIHVNIHSKTNATSGIPASISRYRGRTTRMAASAPHSGHRSAELLNARRSNPQHGHTSEGVAVDMCDNTIRSNHEVPCPNADFN